MCSSECEVCRSEYARVSVKCAGVSVKCAGVSVKCAPTFLNWTSTNILHLSLNVPLCVLMLVCMYLKGVACSQFIAVKQCTRCHCVVANVTLHHPSSFLYCILTPRPHPLMRKRVWRLLNAFLIVPSQQS